VRKVAAADRSMRAGEWERSKFSGSELHGKTLALVGAGRIGGEVAKRAQAFGMRVLVYDPYCNEERARALGVQLVPLDEALGRGDAVSIHVPLTESTAGLISDAQLAMMKRSAVLVNAARGGIVDEGALHRALAAKQIAGAALDVYEQEPLPADHPLRALPNVVLTPHLGASTEEAQQNVAIEIAEAVRDALLHGDLSRAVNAPAVGGEAMRRLRPLLDLAERLGVLAAALAAGPVDSVEVRYAGTADEALRPLAATALVGVLRAVAGQGEVNFVNALHVAQSRGIHVVRTRLDPTRDYAEYVELRLGSRGTETKVGGALLAEAHLRIVLIGPYVVSIDPRGSLLVLRNRDVPGVIGRVGTLLGDAGINIAEYQQSRLEAGGDALAVVRIDSRLRPEIAAKLRAMPEVIDVRMAEMG
jgi:D-3-phosphoglycerate dehydrogenase / 2-oxoglutarate reductase